MIPIIMFFKIVIESFNPNDYLFNPFITNLAIETKNIIVTKIRPIFLILLFVWSNLASNGD